MSYRNDPKGHQMTYQTGTAEQPASSNHRGYRGQFDQGGDYLWWAKTPGFHPLKLLAVLGGFAIFPPLGIAALVYFIWNARRHSWAGGPAAAMGNGQSCGRDHRSRTGNVAFDAHRAKVMTELEAEQQAFAEHRAEQRRKQDQEAFDAFQSKRTSVTPAKDM
jgi:Protein of unknown function (DUF2852)